MNRLTFATLAIPGKAALETLLMVASARQFAGELSKTPIWALAPETHWPFSEAEQAEFASLGVRLIPFESDPEILKFPFAAKVLAAARAEQAAKDNSELLAWLDRDTLVTNPPIEFLLPPGKLLGFRPVHHKLIGPAWDEPLDPFWELIYRVCEIPEKHVFPMTTHLGELVHPYFNAGTFVVRPTSGLLSEWRDTLLRYHRQPEFQAFYEADNRYAIFMHQAIWTGVLLNRLNPDEMLELSPRINYPLHLHAQMQNRLRAAAVNELVTARFEDIFETPDWQKLPFGEPYQTWLSNQPLLKSAKP